MFEKEYYISDLIARHLRDDLNLHEKEALNFWLHSSAANRTLFDQLSSEPQLLNELDQFYSVDKSSLWAKTQNRIADGNSLHQPLAKKISLFSKYKYVSIAASLFLVVGLLLHLTFNNNFNLSKQGQELHNILPGSNKATLTLANGKKIILSDAVNGKLVDDTGVSISKMADGQLIYTLKNVETTGEVKYNTLTTSRGEQYQVILPDGSRVWLNAASSLIYPQCFTPLKKREVKLVGEAYFEVAKDKNRPFNVISRGQNVEVLGTHFNINCYNDEPAVKTTLLEGLVKINATTILKPNEQAVVIGDRIQIVPVIADAFIDWKEGTLAFKSENLQSIMRKISRWYDVQVIYKSNIPDHQTYTGTISRSDQIADVLHVLEEIGGLKFTIQGKNIIVTN